MFRGAMTALVTPFDRDGKLHEEHLKRLIEFQIAGGVDGIVPCGTTGEASTLDYDEHFRVCELTAKFVNGRAKVIIGGGSNNTHRAIELTRFSKEIGADAVLSVGPYYNKPTQEGHYRHFRAIAESADIPIIIYNIPGRTGVNIEPETLLRLSEIPNIAGVKEASGNLDQMMTILRGRPAGFSVLSGDDSLSLPLISVGGDGCISVLANEMPQAFTRMIHAALDNRWDEARRIHYETYSLMRANFVETNPVPVKAALAMMGLIEEVYRLPLCPMQPNNRERLQAILRELKLVE
ncbi:MAG: 4-hydroxy-tetrahydrodipicolinate synthase [Acidimicrobiia bacterium]|nr:4-hydroxy-tetrahydrodipicolinate synthase [Acidimicrobiia bacterium]